VGAQEAQGEARLRSSFGNTRAIEVTLV